MVLVLALAVLVGAPALNVAAAEVPRMSKEELREMLESPDLVIVDVRMGKDWTSSEFKIRGAVREDPGKVESWAGGYDKAKTLVLYCA